MDWDKKHIIYFREKLLDWYKYNQRDFPWRKSGVTNYELIFSEILLQRTQARVVAGYYNTFFAKYPDWVSLIHATDDDLVEIFKPLGLHHQRAKRVRRIIDEYKLKNGILPNNKNELQESCFASLYVSSAYELFVLKKRAALLDVNMTRVLSRFFYLPETKDSSNDKAIQELANKVINVKACKVLNWAILDFAALICQARKPKCGECLLKGRCCMINSNQYTTLL